MPQINNADERPKKAGMKASHLRSFLIFCFVVSLGAGAGLYYLNYFQIEELAIEMNHRVADADASTKQIQQLQILKSQIDRDENLITRANNLFAAPDTYQTQAIRDVRHYAALSGTNVTTTTFSDTPIQGARSFTVEIGSPTSYTNFIRFLRGIESNIPKMEVSKLSIGRASNGGDSVIVDNVIMIIHIKEVSS